ncbi:hypothetical protein Q5P01_024998 [Channa striata]|uniref:Uncharacterized protein n=1 Tax=Channa striata TaxID=64152 RepID=A0AA88IHW4_CHASR|nr:hypothetical protein Q5P01_024998 [Channa striata]
MAGHLHARCETCLAPSSHFLVNVCLTLEEDNSVAVAQSRIMAWMTMLQRNMWLHRSQLPKSIRKACWTAPSAPMDSLGCSSRKLLLTSRECLKRQN